jgi:2-oxo-4-hydroxy-4-carboxy-5-ureidoimidazoline decarboxylase
MSGMDDLNALSADAARQALSACCSSERWVLAVTAGRPYSSVSDLLAASDAAVAAMSEADLSEALDGHPRLGERHVTGWSSQEQAGVAGADARIRAALAVGNAEYEERFGHVYLACATGSGAAELLGFLRERLANEPEAEWRVVASELAKINQLRLRKLVGGDE